MNASSCQGLRLDRRLRTVDYFTLGFGSMVGAGWLILMDDWLRRGGPAGGILGYLLGGLLLLPIALTYGRLVGLLPDAGGEVAYTERVFPRNISFVTGWFMTLAYLIVCPWEAVAIGKLAARAIPFLDSVELYSFGGAPVHLYRLLLGLSVTVLICYLNYRGIRFSATFQNWCTFGLLAVFAVFSVSGLAGGSVSNFSPAFARPGGYGAVVSILLVLQVVPYFMVGFESIAKSSEEARPGFKPGSFARAILLALGIGAGFYAVVILVVSMVYPWTELTSLSFGTAVAFERAFRSRAIGDLILLGAVISLFKVFNGCFVAGTRLTYGMAKRWLLHPSLARVHPRFLTPHVSIAFAGVLTGLGAFMGEAVLVPISEVGSLAVAVGWLAACVSYLRGAGWSGTGIRPGRTALTTAGLGATVSFAFVLMKVLPCVPGHLTSSEYFALAVWMGLGLSLWQAADWKGAADRKGATHLSNR